MVESAEELVVRRSVQVTLEVDAAFDLFTTRMADWWPLPSHSVYGDDAASVTIEPHEGGRIVEASNGGETSVWGTVDRWDAPDVIGFSWHPGEDPGSATRVEVSFVPVDGGTLVELVHTGWEARGDRAAELVQNYGPGWEFVLGRFVSASTRAG